MRPVVPRAAAWLVALLVTVAAALVISIGVSAVFVPDCARCHMTGTFKSATTAGSHAAIPCRACHAGSTVDVRVKFASSQVMGMYLHLMPVDPTVAAVDSGKCLACHADQIKRPVNSSGLRIIHSSCAKGRACTDCHSAVAHGTAVSWPHSSTMEMCFECHGKGKATAKCDACHTARLPSDRIKTGAFAVLHGPNWLRTHGMGDMDTCAACHTASKCAKCHGAGVPHSATFIVEHPDAARSATAKCTMCHKPKFCIDCHGYVMPHPAAFISGHSTIVKSNGAATCRKCHDQTDCQGCHVNHIHPTSLEELKNLGLTVAPSAGTTGSPR